MYNNSTMVIRSDREFKILNNKSFADRFYSKIDKSSDCHIWTGAIKCSGYGVITLGGRGEGLISSNRAAFILHNNRLIKDGHIILHLCNNKLCCNPEHLIEGNHSDNITQALNDGLRKFGEETKQAKLSNLDIEKIREMRRNGFSFTKINKIYNYISYCHISNICNNKSRIRG